MTRVTHFQVKEAICARLSHKDRRAVNLAARALLRYAVVPTVNKDMVGKDRAENHQAQQQRDG